MMSLARQAPVITSQPRFPEGSSSLWHLPGTASVHIGPRADSVRNFPAVTTNGHVHIPPPPKLIKISEAAKSTTANEDPVTVTSRISVISSTYSNNKSIVENKEARYMQAIVDLQERIDHQLASGACTSPDGGLAFMKPPLVLQSGEQDNVSSFCPPQYCVAEAPELLLDIISRTPFVKIHQHTIEKIERLDEPIRDRMHPPSLQLLTPRGPNTPPKLIPHQSHPLPRSSPTSPPPSRRDSDDTSRKRKAQMFDTEPPPLRRHRPNMLLSTYTTPHTQSSSPIVHPVVTNQARIPNAMAATSIPNYCLALNTFPVMLVNPNMPMVQPIPTIPLSAGLAGNQVLYYMTPNGLVKPAEQQQINNTSPILHSPHALRTPHAHSIDDLDYSMPLKIERVCNDAAKHLAGGSVSPAGATNNKVPESDCSEKSEESGSSSHSTPTSNSCMRYAYEMYMLMKCILASNFLC